MLGLVYGKYAEIVQGDLDRAEKCYMQVLYSREKQYEKNHIKMVGITRAVESLNEKRAKQIGRAEILSISRMDHDNRPMEGDPDAEIAQHLESVSVSDVCTRSCCGH